MTKYLNRDITKENAKKVHAANNTKPSFNQEWRRKAIKGMTLCADLKLPTRPSTGKEIDCADGMIKVKVILKNWPCSLYKVNHAFTM